MSFASDQMVPTLKLGSNSKVHGFMERDGCLYNIRVLLGNRIVECRREQPQAKPIIMGLLLSLDSISKSSETKCSPDCATR